MKVMLIMLALLGAALGVGISTATVVLDGGQVQWVNHVGVIPLPQISAAPDVTHSPAVTTAPVMSDGHACQNTVCAAQDEWMPSEYQVYAALFVFFCLFLLCSFAFVVWSLYRVDWADEDTTLFSYSNASPYRSSAQLLMSIKADDDYPDILQVEPHVMRASPAAVHAAALEADPASPNIAA